MSKKFYFQKGEPMCFTKQHHLEFMQEYNIQEMEVCEAKREVGNGFFFCKKYDEIGESSDTGCGRSCEGYLPKNGKSGCCKYYGYTYECTDKIVTLKTQNHDNQ